MSFHITTLLDYFNASERNGKRSILLRRSYEYRITASCARAVDFELRPPSAHIVNLSKLQRNATGLVCVNIFFLRRRTAGSNSKQNTPASMSQVEKVHPSLRHITSLKHRGGKCVTRAACVIDRRVLLHRAACAVTCRVTGRENNDVARKNFQESHIYKMVRVFPRYWSHWRLISCANLNKSNCLNKKNHVIREFGFSI